MKKALLTFCASVFALGLSAQSDVYMTREITPESLVKIYEVLGRPATGKVAVKISTGEPGGHNFLRHDIEYWIKWLIYKGYTVVSVY